MQRININPRSAGKASRARAAVRVLRKQGYTWDGRQWQKPWAPKIITLDVRECDIDKLKNSLAKEPCAKLRLMPYQEKYMRNATGLHQIAEPGQSEGGGKP